MARSNVSDLRGEYDRAGISIDISIRFRRLITRLRRHRLPECSAVLSSVRSKFTFPFLFLSPPSFLLPHSPTSLPPSLQGVR
jgi:hypothetical protein